MSGQEKDVLVFMFPDHLTPDEAEQIHARIDPSVHDHYEVLVTGGCHSVPRDLADRLLAVKIFTRAQA